MPAKIALLYGLLVLVCSCSYTFKHEITEFSQLKNKPNISGEWKTDEDPETKKSYRFTIQEIGDQYKLTFADTINGETKEYWVKTITNSAQELIDEDSSYGVFDKFFIKIYRN